MIRRPPRASRIYPLFPYATLFRAVDGAPAPARHRAFVGGTADAIDDLMALPPEIKHLRDKLRRVLQVAIELNRAIARRRLVGGEQRALIAAVARKADDMHLRVPRRHVPPQREGAVGRMIVGEDDFVIIVGKGDRKSTSMNSST